MMVFPNGLKLFQAVSRRLWVSEPDVIALKRDLVQFGRNFVRSEAFRALFQEGMELVEETAAYLDGPGREDSRALPRGAVVAYASESMRLTTRLMQIASWLLLQRAVAEGEMSPHQASVEKQRVRLASQDTATALSDFEALPSRLKELIGLAARFQARIIHLEHLISEGEARPRVSGANPVAAQQSLLARAFGPAPFEAQ
jgi:regulator of CtrA degradation